MLRNLDTVPSWVHQPLPRLTTADLIRWIRQADALRRALKGRA